jgi:chromo domain-containing protein 1
MFARNDSKGSTTLTDRRAFLVFHPEQHSEELELITRWLLMHHVQIAGTHYQGAWPVFQQQIKRGGSATAAAASDAGTT